MAGVDALSQEYFARWPVGNASYTSTAYAAAVEIEARNSKNVVQIAALTGDVTINLSTTITLQPSAIVKKVERKVGDEIVLYVTASGANRTVGLGTGITGADIVVTSAKTNMITLMYVSETLGYVVKHNQQID